MSVVLLALQEISEQGTCMHTTKKRIIYPPVNRDELYLRRQSDRILCHFVDNARHGRIWNFPPEFTQFVTEITSPAFIIKLRGVPARLFTAGS